jgi:hypothetical protein
MKSCNKKISHTKKTFTAPRLQTKKAHLTGFVWQVAPIFNPAKNFVCLFLDKETKSHKFLE